MDLSLEFYLRVVVVGIGATLLMDFWRYLLFKSMGVISLDLGLLGRWVGHLFQGKFFHQAIGKSQAVPGETLLGWLSHYAIGIAFAFLLPVIWGEEWLNAPTLFPAMLVGLGTIFAPWLLMQPAMGIGVAASKAPKPNHVRLRNFAIHSVYGLGLFASALLLKELFLMGIK